MLLELNRLTNEFPDGYPSTPQCHEHNILCCVCVCMFVYISIYGFGKETLVISHVTCRFTDMEDDEEL